MKSLLLGAMLALCASAEVGAQTTNIYIAPGYQGPSTVVTTADMIQRITPEQQRAMDAFDDHNFDRAMQEYDKIQQHVCDSDPYVCNRWK